jgi:hypothetical protein
MQPLCWVFLLEHKVTLLEHKVTIGRETVKHVAAVHKEPAACMPVTLPFKYVQSTAPQDRPAAHYSLPSFLFKAASSSSTSSSRVFCGVFGWLLVLLLLRVLLVPAVEVLLPLPLLAVPVLQHNQQQA